MHIETLKMFCDLADLRSFSKTADKHIVSQSAVSQQVAQLEIENKCQLLNRQKRPLELTAAGEIFYRAAKDIVDRYELLKSELNSLKSAAQARINVGAIYSIGMHTLPDYLKKFMVKKTNVNIHVEYFTADKIYEMVLSGELDIGIVAVPRMDKRLEVYEFEDEPLVLACGAKHPLAAQSQIDIHKLQFERFIGFEDGTPTRAWIDAIFQRYSMVIRPVMEFDNVETVKKAVEINSGVSILPRQTVVQELAAGSIKAIDFENERFVRPTGIIIRKDKVLSPDARYLID
ncbi:MAG: LysR family transcriptional regulator, partial [Sedimentisphaerales bacterium]|nr:LysR family transcriptional regulator [Sedimentisphaerales bacterium]